MSSKRLEAYWHISKIKSFKSLAGMISPLWEDSAVSPQPDLYSFQIPTGRAARKVKRVLFHGHFDQVDQVFTLMAKATPLLTRIFGFHENGAEEVKEISERFYELKYAAVCDYLVLLSKGYGYALEFMREGDESITAVLYQFVEVDREFIWECLDTHVPLGALGEVKEKPKCVTK